MEEQSSAYLDHAATTPIRADVADKMASAAVESFGNPSGGHAVARRAKAVLEAARESVADDLGASPDEIVFTGSGTEADNLGVAGAARAARAAGRGDGVVVSAFEHKAVLAAARRLATEGFCVREAPITPGGLVDVDALGDLVDERTVVVSAMLVNNEVGTIQPLADVVEVVRARAPHAVVHTDAVQAAAWVDVAGLAAGVELISISAHKLGGPKGVGVLVVRRSTPLVPLLEGGGQEHDRRAGTANVPGAVGLAAALRATVDERTATAARVGALRDRLRDHLLEIPGSWENGDRAAKIAGNVAVGFDGVEAEALLVLADRSRVYAAAGSSCSSGATEPSHVLGAMGLDPTAAAASIRLSLGFASVDADVDRALAVLPPAIVQLRAPRGAGVGVGR